MTQSGGHRDAYRALEPAIPWSEVVRLIRQLDIPLSQLVVVAGASMAARGLRNATDIDLVVSEASYSELRGRGWREEIYQPTAGRPKRLLDGWFDVGTLWGKGDFRPKPEEIFATAEVIDSILCIPLTEILKWKEQALRPKDIPDIGLIRATLGMNRDGHDGS